MKPLTMMLALVALLLLSACGGLAGEVPIVATLTPLAGAAASDDAGYPAMTPNLVSGAAVFAQRCTSCHGVNGDGQGELVLAGQVGAIPSFLDAAAMRAITPDHYFDIVTNGNLEKLMPPWKDALTEQQRWDVAHYVLTLHYTPDQLTMGQKLYEATCLECHGVTGVGNGEKQRLLGTEAYDLTYYRDMAFVSDNDLIDVMRYGKGEVMPAQEGKLSDTQMAAIAAYTRTFSTSRDASAVQAQATVPFNDASFTISGSITNGTAGAGVPTALTVYLNYGSEARGVQTLQTTSTADGTYRFEDVPRLADSAYFIYVTYKAAIFSAEVRQADAIGASLTEPLTIYETSEDPSVITVAALDTRLEPFPAMEDASMGTGLLVTQTFTFHNDRDRAFLLSQSGRTFSVLMVMPPGSIALNAASNPRFIVAQDQFAVIFTEALSPGDTPIELVYFWPYDDGAVFDQTLNYALSGSSTVVVSPKALKISDAADWTLDSSAPFANQYTQTLEVARGESFRFELTGDINDTTSDDRGLITADTLIPLIAVIVMVLMGGLLIISLLRRRNPQATQQLLLRQIAELDAMHEHGQINHDVYQRQRQTLKDRLTTLMAAQSPIDPS